MHKTDISVLDRQTQLTDNQKLSDYSKILREEYSLNNKILLVQPPQFLLEAFNQKVAKSRGCYVYPPTGLQCLAQALSGRGLEIDILDLNYLLLKKVIEDESFDYRNWLEILAEYLENEGPSIVGVTSINIYSDVFKPGYPLTAALEYLRRKNKYLLLAGGPIATNEYSNYLLKDLCHFVIEGEGENKINFLFDYLFNGGSTRPPVQGIYFKFDHQIEQSCGQRDLVRLEGNLIDTYALVPIEDYHKVGSLNPYSRMAGQDKPFSVFQLVRGCRANCKFCGVADFMGKGTRCFPVKALLEEIKYLVENKEILHFDVLDDDFLINQKATKELLLGLVELRQKYPISWSSNNGLIAASITDELMTLMRDSGCVGFRIGVESGNPGMLKKLRKPANLELLRRSAAVLNRFPEIFTGGNYIIGLLGEETFGQMLATLKFSCELNLDWASFAMFQFTSTAVAVTENFNLKEREVTEFVPSKDSSNRQIVESAEIVSGPEVFNLPQDCIPSREQVKQIWFTFNLVANYINNKNLKPGGRVDKFIAWVEAVQVVYPDNCYMPLFAGIGHALLGNQELARKRLEKAKENLRGSDYWVHRFKQFGLDDLVINFPQGTKEAQEALEILRRRYLKWTS